MTLISVTNKFSQILIENIEDGHIYIDIDDEYNSASVCLTRADALKVLIALDLVYSEGELDNV